MISKRHHTHTQLLVQEKRHKVIIRRRKENTEPKHKTLLAHLIFKFNKRAREKKTQV